MIRRVEITLAPRGRAVIETYLNDRRTSMSRALPLEAAREQARDSGLKVIDHTAGFSRSRLHGGSS